MCKPPPPKPSHPSMQKPSCLIAPPYQPTNQPTTKLPHACRRRFVSTAKEATLRPLNHPATASSYLQDGTPHERPPTTDQHPLPIPPSSQPFPPYLSLKRRRAVSGSRPRGAAPCASPPPRPRRGGPRRSPVAFGIACCVVGMRWGTYDHGVKTGVG